MSRTARVLSWLGVLAFLGPACSPTTGPDLSGEWAYSASEIRIAGRPDIPACEIRGMKLRLGPWRFSGFYGRSEGGVFVCGVAVPGVDRELPSYPVRRGGAVLDFVAFDIGSPAWRHDGRIAGDTMSGFFILDHGAYAMQGRFHAVRLHPVSTVGGEQ